MIKPNINAKGRLKRVVTGFVFIVVAFYFWFTLEVNKLAGLYRLVLIIPLYVAVLSFAESFFSYCVLKDRRSRISVKIHAFSFVMAAVISVISVFL